MATGTRSDMKVYDPRIQGGFREKVAQNIELFNTASRGAIRLSSASKPGDYELQAFFKRISGLVSRRDPTSTSAATAVKPTQGEFVSVKVNRRLGPLDVTRDAMVKAGINFGDDAAAFALGEWGAEAATVDRLNTAIRCVASAIRNQAGLVYDASAIGSGFMATDHLIQGLGKRGDAASGVIAWVMHSKAHTDLMSAQAGGTVTGIADMVVHEAQVGTISRPVIVTDSPDLIIAGSPNKYITLGLSADAVVVEDTEDEYIVSDVITGLDNIVHRIQGEHAFNVSVRGCAWDTAAGVNPTDAALATVANWAMVVDSIKNHAGVAVITK